jgi:putative membrane protein
MWVALLLIRWLFISSALAMAAALVPDVVITGGLLGLLGVAAIFGLVNAVIGPVARALAVPFNAITFGLSALVVNGALLALAAGLSRNLDVGGFLQTMLAAFVVTAVAVTAEFMLTGRSAPPARPVA